MPSTPKVPTSKFFSRYSDAGKRKLLILFSTWMKPASSAKASASLAPTPISAMGVIAPPSVLVISSSGTTARSCATRIATASRPAGVSFSSASSIIFIATAVEEMESMKPITTPPSTSPCTA